MAEAAIEAAEAAVLAVVAEVVALVRLRVRERALKTSADTTLPPQTGGRTGFQQSTGPPDTVLGLSPNIVPQLHLPQY